MVGLTGNFGMGKSYVLSLFRDLGAVTLDSDRIVALLLVEETVVKKIRALLGSDVISPEGNLDRKAIAGKIFNDLKLKRDLEALMHPLVFRKIDEFIDRIKDKGGIIIVEVPLLFEGGYQDRFTKIITVYTTQKTALERLRMSGVSRKEALLRLKAQMPVVIKKARADYAIDNNGGRDETRKQVEKVYALLLEDSKK